MSSAYQETTNTTNAGAQGTGSANAGSKIGGMIKEGLTKFHGAGEAIRGNVNTFADNVTNTDDTRSRAEVQRGVNEMSTGKYEGAHTAGVTPKDTMQERIQGPGVGHHAGVGSTTTGQTTFGQSTTGQTTTGHHVTGAQEPAVKYV